MANLYWQCSDIILVDFSLFVLLQIADSLYLHLIMVGWWNVLLRLIISLLHKNQNQRSVNENGWRKTLLTVVPLKTLLWQLSQTICCYRFIRKLQKILNKLALTWKGRNKKRHWNIRMELSLLRNTWLYNSLVQTYPRVCNTETSMYWEGLIPQDKVTLRAIIYLCLWRKGNITVVLHKPQVMEQTLGDLQKFTTSPWECCREQCQGSLWKDKKRPTWLPLTWKVLGDFISFLAHNHPPYTHIPGKRYRIRVPLQKKWPCYTRNSDEGRYCCRKRWITHEK